MNARRNPKVSVIIPTYNRAGLLPRAVNSALAQTLEDIEVIIIDDASTDHTPRVAARFDDPRVRYIRHECNRHLATARNTGIFNSRGMYIALLDDDDELLPNALEELAALLDDSPPDVALAYGKAIFVDETAGTRSQPYGPMRNGDMYEDALALKAPPGPTGWLFTASALREVGGFVDGLKRVEDIELIVRLGVRRYGVRCIEQATFVRHQGQEIERLTDASSDNLAQVLAFTRTHVNTYGKELKARPCAHAKIFHDLASTSLSNDSRRWAAWALAKAAFAHRAPGHVFLCAKLLVWQVSPLSHIRDHARAFRNKLRGRK